MRGKNPVLNKYLLFVFIILINFSVTLSRSRVKKIDELMKCYVDNGQFNGSILVAEKGEIIYQKAFGYSNFEWNIPNTLDTKFRIASTTKPFTALLVLQCVERGLLSLDGKLTGYLPDYPAKNGDRITIHHLLSHTSGLIDYPDVPGGFDQHERVYHSQKQMLNYFSETDLFFEPGTQFRYSNFGYYLLGVILEKVTGKSYAELLREKICGPAGMKHTELENNSAIVENRAYGYTYHLFNGIQNAPPLDMSVTFSAGGLLSTVYDLYLFDRALHSDKLISPQYKKLLFQPVLNNYAYGWEKKTLQLGCTGDEVTVVQHPGSINGFGANIRRFPDEEFVIIQLYNLVENPYTGMILADGNKLAGNIAAIMYDRDYDLPKKSAVFEMTKVLMAVGTDSAIAFYENLKKDRQNNYYFAEMELNKIGLKLFFAERKFEPAQKILQMNIREHPQSYNVYDSIAYVYMNHGEPQKALDYFNKGVEIYNQYPANQQYANDYRNALEQIKRLSE